MYRPNLSSSLGLARASSKRILANGAQQLTPRSTLGVADVTIPSSSSSVSVASISNHCCPPTRIGRQQGSSRYFSSTRNVSKSLYTWGTNKSGCLLQDKTDASAIVWQPELATSWSNYSAAAKGGALSSLSCGAAETGIVTSDGTVLVVGENKQGQLGLGHKNPVPTLTEIPNVEPMTKIVLGTNTGAMISKENGDLYTFGFGGSLVQGMGVLGHGNGETYLTPKRVESLVEDGCSVQDVVLGESHTTVLTTEGEVLTTGASSYGRLGNGETSEDSLYFDSVEILQEGNVIQIAGGKSFTLALTKEGVVYGWGRNHKGQLGTGFGMAVDMYSMEQIPTPIDGDELINRTVTKIAAGSNHAACITTSGELFWWGMSLNLEPVRVAEVLHTKIIDIACGQDYTMALSEDNHIYIWGAGKTGVLGVGSGTKNLNQAQMIKSMAEKETVSFSAGWIHAACLVNE
ncbi:regulator of chromosome condensation RCC1 repeat protein [Nitzschia inconspicua]|uniref:Regulator of chromosome condensation RCC1 repeat protein n=1 Tax=Nitzschia inconspicua TaxID=303405 RepID=A0A9K3LSJ3_9STRA|nr:regulator of chromosome condensation RCC1 repeat protein [Nitzschia inconspicua]